MSEGRSAGVDEDIREPLKRVFSDMEAWREMAEGAKRLCRDKFDLDRNVERLCEVMGGVGDVLNRQKN